MALSTGDTPDPLWQAAPADAASCSDNELSRAWLLTPAMLMDRVLGRRRAASAGPLMRTASYDMAG